jgi:hypothetical protein
MKINEYIWLMKSTTKYSLIIGVIAFVIMGIASCYKPPVYSVIPSISFKSFVVNANRSATLQVTFTDGDGDIGYPTSDNNPPFDFFVLPLYDSTGLGAYKYYWIPPQSPLGDTLVFPYNIPNITPIGKYKALSGQIQIQMDSASWYIKDKVNMKFMVWIVDRAGHISNRITTIPIVSP